jgi:hypothetical protein
MIGTKMLAVAVLLELQIDNVRIALNSSGKIVSVIHFGDECDDYGENRDNPRGRQSSQSKLQLAADPYRKLTDLKRTVVEKIQL